MCTALPDQIDVLQSTSIESVKNFIFCLESIIDLEFYSCKETAQCYDDAETEEIFNQRFF